MENRRTYQLLRLIVITAILGQFGLLFLVDAAATAERQGARVTPADVVSRQEIRIHERLSTADTVVVRSDRGEQLRVEGWIVGQELLKSYLDPAAAMIDPYPFTVTEVALPMHFRSGGQLTVSVDVELTEFSKGECPYPGGLIDSSSWHTLTIPDSGTYDIWIPLDNPVVVIQPFFVGFLISDLVPAEMAPAVFTDNQPRPCLSYNIWDSQIGFVDLGEYSSVDAETEFAWPGILTMYAIGVPGKSIGLQAAVAPELAWVSPGPSTDCLYSPAELWVEERSGSTVINYVLFEYSSGGPFTEIGLVFDGASPNRNGIDPAIAGSGFSMPWDFSMLSEGTYTLRATAVDDSGQTAVITRQIELEPTPPVPTIASPTHWDRFCGSENFILQIPDEDISLVQLSGRSAPGVYSQNLAIIDQSYLGSVDGSPYDGNSIDDGEYGDVYCGPAAASIALRLWFERGYTAAMTRGAVTLNTHQVAESLAVYLNTRSNFGTTDEYMIAGLSSYLADHGDELTVEYHRYPSYLDLRIWHQNYQHAVILGLGGTPGMWVALDGFEGWSATDDGYPLTISNPLTGRIDEVYFRPVGARGDVLVGGDWHPVEIMVTAVARDWQVFDLILFGSDLNGADGWSVTWVPGALTEGERLMAKARAQDATGHEGRSSVLIEYGCTSQYVAGDFTGDAMTDASDLYALIEFVTRGGPEPIGGAYRGDTNCDGLINVADIVYYLNYLYRLGSPPCY